VFGLCSLARQEIKIKMEKLQLAGPLLGSDHNFLSVCDLIIKSNDTDRIPYGLSHKTFT
jgi:hypothetical protein